MKTKIKFILIVAFLFLLISCGTTGVFSCPYAVSCQGLELGEHGDEYKFAGARFSILNDSARTVRKFTLSFTLYDSDGNNPLIGSNCVVYPCERTILPGETEEFTVPLDQFVSDVPEEPYSLDFIYIREIDYSDGSSWKDPYGMYCAREAYE